MILNNFIEPWGLRWIQWSRAVVVKPPENRQFWVWESISAFRTSVLKDPSEIQHVHSHSHEIPMRETRIPIPDVDRYSARTLLSLKFLYRASLQRVPQGACAAWLLGRRVVNIFHWMMSTWLGNVVVSSMFSYWRRCILVSYIHQMYSVYWCFRIMGPEEEFELFDSENRWMSVFQVW